MLSPAVMALALQQQQQQSPPHAPQPQPPPPPPPSPPALPPAVLARSYPHEDFQVAGLDPRELGVSVDPTHTVVQLSKGGEVFARFVAPVGELVLGPQRCRTLPAPRFFSCRAPAHRPPPPLSPSFFSSSNKQTKHQA